MVERHELYVPVAINHGNLYNKLLALVLVALRSIPCRGERHRVRSRTDGYGNGSGWSVCEEQDQEMGRGGGGGERGGREGGERATVGRGCEGVLGVLRGRGRQSGLYPITLETAVTEDLSQL